MSNNGKDELKITTESIKLGLENLNRNEVLRILSESLKNQGFVIDGFYEAILKREESFPTGINTKYFGIAIPHTDPEFVNQCSISVGILNTAAQFNEMANETETVDVYIVFLLALTNANKHIKILQGIMNLIKDKEALSQLLKSKNQEDVRDILNKFLS